MNEESLMHQIELDDLHLYSHSLNDNGYRLLKMLHDNAMFKRLHIYGFNCQSQTDVARLASSSLVLSL